MIESSSGDETGMFARWLAARVSARGASLRQVAIEVGIDYSYLYKVINSHLPRYAQYRRPGYAYTVRLGRHFGDVAGALSAAEYEAIDVDGVQTEAVLNAARTSMRRPGPVRREYEQAALDPLSGMGFEIDLSSIAALPLGSIVASAGPAVVKGDPERADGSVADILPGGVRAIRISGDCMEPEYFDGDVVLVRESRLVKNGDKVIAVARETGEVLCKQFRDDRGKGRRLEPLNPGSASARHLGEWEYRIVGVVEGSIRIGR